MSTPVGPWQFAVVMAVAAVGAIVAIAGLWRVGAVVLGTALLLAAAFRLVLPTSGAGLLRVRHSRAADVVTLGLFGAATVVLALVVPEAAG